MKKLLSSLSFITLLMAACTAIQEPMPVKDVESESVSTMAFTRSETGATTFDTLPNPYSLNVMQAVYDQYDGNTTLQPTDLYVRFLPKDSLQLDVLTHDYNLELFEYPLDLDIGDGDVYIDPTIPEGEITWQYTTVGTDFVFPSGIIYEILEYCYIPDEGETITSAPGTRASGVGAIDVETAAFKMLGYGVQGGGIQDFAATRPTGTIRVYDNTTLKYVPVRGVKIRCHTIIRWSTAYTNESGYYSMGSKFLIGPHYAIVFDNCKGFDIWGNWGPLARANHNMGWHSKQGHSTDLGVGSNAWEWAVVNNAGYDYYKMCEKTGITKPPANLKMWVFKNHENSSAPMIRRMSAVKPLSQKNWGTFVAWGTNIVFPIAILDGLTKLLQPDLFIGTKGDSYQKIYETVNHELAHSSHFSKAGTDYWSKYISYIIASLGYGKGGKVEAGYCDVGEMWGYAMGAIQKCEQFKPARLSDKYYEPSYYYSDKEYFFNRPGDGEWIKPDPIWALYTRGVLTKKEIFDCLTSDVNTRAKLMDKMCSKYPDKAAFIRAAFAFNDVSQLPVITGPDRPAFNTNATYSVPVNSTIAGTVFTGWTVPGSKAGTDYQVTGGTTGSTLNIKFLNAKRHTLTATFRLPDNTPGIITDNPVHTVSKVIDLSLPGVPFVSADKTKLFSLNERVTFSVKNAQSGMRYEWELKGFSSTLILEGQSVSASMSSFTGKVLSSPIHTNAVSINGITAKCRGRNGDIVSSWSMPVSVSYIAPTQMY